MTKPVKRYIEVEFNSRESALTLYDTFRDSPQWENLTVVKNELTGKWWVRANRTKFWGARKTS